MMSFIFDALTNAWLFALLLALYEFGIRKEFSDNEFHICAALLVYALVLGIVIARFQMR